MIAVLFIVLAVSFSLAQDLDCGMQKTCDTCTNSAQRGGCKWNVDEGSCMFKPVATLDITVSDPEDCSTSVSCASVTDCAQCVDTVYKDGKKCVWVPKEAEGDMDGSECQAAGLTTFFDLTIRDKAECGMTNEKCDTYTDCTACLNDAGGCAWNLDENKCAYKYSPSLFGNAVASEAAQCSLKGCREFNDDCAKCVLNKYDGENACIFKPNDSENKCQTPDATNKLTPYAFDAATCDAKHQDCDLYQDCESCVVDLGTVGCEWNVDDASCGVRTPYNPNVVARNVDQCSRKSCNGFESCETCLANKWGDEEDEVCQWFPGADEGESKCQKPDLSNALSNKIDELGKCGAKDQACNLYTDCKGCVIDIGKVGCTWSLQSKTCSNRPTTEGDAIYDYNNCDRKPCNSFTECDECTANVYGKNKTCVFAPEAEENKCQTLNAFEKLNLFKDVRKDATECAAKNQECSLYTDCKGCATDVGKVGCSWSLQTSTCGSAASSTEGDAIGKGEHEFCDTRKACKTITDCEGCVANAYGDDKTCIWNVGADDNKCQTQNAVEAVGDILADIRKTAAECAAKNQDCDLYTDCETCVSDAGKLGCVWNHNEGKCSSQAAAALGRVKGIDYRSEPEECAAVHSTIAGVAIILSAIVALIA